MVECPVKNRPEITIAEHLLGSAPSPPAGDKLLVKIEAQFDVARNRPKFRQSLRADWIGGVFGSMALVEARK
jgi:hypothetical protein